MGKAMARIQNGTVRNLEWHSDRQPTTAELVEIGTYPVAVGDLYENGTFCREGTVLLSQEESAKQDLAEAEAIIAELVELIYETDMEVIG